MMLALRLAAFALLASATLAAQDPPPPKGGFPIRETLGRVVTFADGYRTTVDVRLPDPVKVKAPPTGWPVLLWVHGLALDRTVGRSVLVGYARLGYVTIAYDVRGQGSAKKLNSTGGSTVVGGPEKADMAEILHLEKRRLGPLMDFDRIGVIGESQGGLHAWAAAAWSGRRMPAPRGGITTFPVIRAVAPQAFSPDLNRTVNPEGNAFGTRAVMALFAPSSIVTFEQRFQTALQIAFVTQNFDIWKQVARDPWRADVKLLASSKVPVYAHSSWNDSWNAPNSTIDAVRSLPAGTPRLLYMTTGVHGAPRNILEQRYRAELERRWLEVFLKGRKDDISRQPGPLLARVPDDVKTYQDLTSVWGLERLPGFPAPPGARPLRLYLRAGGVLSSTPPSGAEPKDPIQHTVPAAYTPRAFLLARGRPSEVFKFIPLRSVFYRGAPLAADTELAGRGSVDVEIDSTARNLQIHAALFDEDPAGNRRFLVDGFRALRGRAPGAGRYRIELADTLYVLRKGHRIVLAIENHTWWRPVGQSELRTVPYFETYRFDCVHTPARPSRLTLPVLARPALTARVAAAQFSRSNAANVAIPIDGSPVRAGALYVTLVGASGTVPGFSFGGARIPLNVDPLTRTALQEIHAAPFVRFTGKLDALGRGRAALVLPANAAPPDTVGRLLSFATVTLENAGVSVSAPSSLRIEH